MDWNLAIREAIRDDRIILHRQRIFTPNLPGERFEVLSRILLGNSLIPPICWLKELHSDQDLAADFDLWVVKKVFHRMAGAKNAQAWVNLTGSSVQEILVGQVEEVARRTGVSPSSVCFEVTEQVAVHSPYVLVDLARVGFDIAIDDCGCGYSNWAEMVDLAVTWVKIDGQLMQTPRRMLAAKHLTLLAKELNLKVVAEWIQRPAQAAWMQRWGCDGFQGFNVPSVAEGVPTLWSDHSDPC